MPHKKQITTTCFFFLFISLLGNGGGLFFEHAGHGTDLEQARVYCMVQDQFGFLWLGTNDGLLRYDGYNVKVFRHQQNDSTSISSNFITALLLDSQGRLWIGTSSSGVNVYNPDYESFKRISFLKDSTSSPKLDFIKTIFENKSGFVLVGTEAGIQYAQLPNKPPIDDLEFDELAINSNERLIIKSIVEQDSSTLWVGTLGHGLYQVKVKLYGKELNVLEIQGYKEGKTEISNSISCLLWESGKGLWIGSSNDGLFLYDNIDKNFIRYDLSNNKTGQLNSNRIVSLFQDSRKQLWIGTDGGGLNTYNPQMDRFFYYKYDSFVSGSLSNDAVLSFFEDRSGILWIGTWIGLNKYNRHKNQFKNFLHHPKNPNGLNHKEITCFMGEKEALWIGTNGGGINRLDWGSKHFSHYSEANTNLSDNVVLAINKDLYGDYWFGTYLGGINIFRYPQEYSNEQKRRYLPSFTQYLHNSTDPNSLSGDFVTFILEASDSSIWIGTSGSGLCVYDRRKDLFRSYRYNAANPKSLANDVVVTIYEDSNKNIWVGTWGGGLDRFDPTDQSFVHHVHHENEPNSLNDNIVFSIHEDDHGNFWIGTSMGLNKFSPNNGLYEHYTEQDGLPNNNVYGILSDSHEFLWLSTNRGLSRFNPKTGEFRNFSSAQGIFNQQFNKRAYAKLWDGSLVFGGKNGFVWFHPDSIHADTTPPQIALIEMGVRSSKGDSINFRNLPLYADSEQRERLELSYQENDFYFEYAALHFGDPSSNQYRIRLFGYEANWNHVGNRRYAAYTNIPPGEYWLKIQASNADGIWNREGLSIFIKINAPWWKSLWFKILGIISISFLVVSVYYLRIYQVNRRNRLLEGLVEVRTKELKERQERIEEQAEELRIQRDELFEVNHVKDKLFSIVAHDLKNPFNNMKGFLELLRMRFKKYDEAKRLYMIEKAIDSNEHISNLLENLLNWARSQQGNIVYTPENKNIIAIISDNLKLLANQANAKGIELIFDCDQKEIVIELDVNLMHAVFRNLLSNAIKFTESGGKVRITCQPKPHSLLLKISDTGVGISKEDMAKLFDKSSHFRTSGTNNETGTGLGLMMCHDFIEQHGGELWVESELGKGSTFFIELPST